MTTVHSPATTSEKSWQQKLPVLSAESVTLREVRPSDAPALFALLTSAEVTRFISAPPASPEGFERFVSWAQRQREAGCGACFAVTLKGFDTAIGMLQVRKFESDPAIAEWGFAIASPFWGTGVFTQAAELVVAFAFETMDVNRLEARVAVRNGRGNAALRKVGAVQEGVLRRSFLCGGEYLDQALYAILRDEWLSLRSLPAAGCASVH
jgi:RimJ/RimL family protein N-acetyltransferase